MPQNTKSHFHLKNPCQVQFRLLSVSILETAKSLIRADKSMTDPSWKIGICWVFRRNDRKVVIDFRPAEIGVQ